MRHGLPRRDRKQLQSRTNDAFKSNFEWYAATQIETGSSLQGSSRYKRKGTSGN
jgi:hypothetical protein